MRHRKSGLKLNMSGSHRQAMFRNMVTSLLKHDRIKTTDTRAKELRRWADHIITLAKRGDLHARRQALSIVREKDVVHKLFEEAGERFGKVNGGYTRITKIGRRPGDCALVSVIELISAEEKPKKKKAKPETPKETPASTAPTPTDAVKEKTEAGAADGVEATADDGSEDTTAQAAPDSEVAENTDAQAAQEKTDEAEGQKKE
jgi:large subunit ribosomal protein L17